MHIKLLIKMAVVVAFCNCCIQPQKKEQSVSKDKIDVITCNGHCFMSHEGVSEISASIGGKIISVAVEQGRNIHSGQVLALIENTDLLVVQKEYLESVNLQEFYREEYTRQGDLTIENATSMKRLQIAKRDYISAELEFQTLRKHLIALGINPDSLNPEEISARLYIKSPVKGILSEIYIHPGEYVEKGDKLFEMAKQQSLLIKLQIPEKQVSLILKNQKVSFFTAADTAVSREANIISEAVLIDPLNQMATVLAKPVDENIELLPGISVTATIFQDR